MGEATPYPSAYAVAAVLVAACRETGEDPEAIATHTDRYSRAAVYAFVVLAHRFQEVPHARVFGWVQGHYDYSAGAQRALQQVRDFPSQHGKITRWFDLSLLNRVCTAVGWPEMTAEEARCLKPGGHGTRQLRSERYDRAAENMAKVEASGLDVPKLKPKQLDEMLAKSVDQLRAERRAREEAEALNELRQRHRAPMRGEPIDEHAGEASPLAGQPRPGQSALDQRMKETAE